MHIDPSVRRRPVKPRVVPLREYKQLLCDSIIYFLHSRRNLALNTRRFTDIQTHIGIQKVTGGEPAIQANLVLNEALTYLQNAGKIFHSRHADNIYGWTLY